LAVEPGLERLEQRPGADLAHELACLGAGAADLGLDLVELGDARQGRRGDRRLAADGELVKAPPAVTLMPSSAYPAMLISA